MENANAGFQFLLLRRMSPQYRIGILADLGLSVADAEVLEATCPLMLPDQLDSDLRTYCAFLGEPVKSEQLTDAEVPAGYEGTVAHHFILSLWPHLFWTVPVSPRGSPWNVGFQNQALPKKIPSEPCLVRPGVWTRYALERLASETKIYDGWSADVVLRVVLDSGVFEASFSYGLLQEWERVSEA